MQKKSQNEIILKLLQNRKNGITGKQAYKYAHSMNLPQRIYDLRKQGHKISSRFVEVQNDFGEMYRVKQYKLEKLACQKRS